MTLAKEVPVASTDTMIAAVEEVDTEVAEITAEAVTTMTVIEDTEEDVYDRVVRPAPTAVPTAQSSQPPPSAIKKSTSINDVNRAASGSATATTTTAAAAAAAAAAAPPGSLGERRMSKEPHRSVSMMNTSATKLYVPYREQNVH